MLCLFIILTLSIKDKLFYIQIVLGPLYLHKYLFDEFVILYHIVWTSPNRATYMYNYQLLWLRYY